MIRTQVYIPDDLHRELMLLAKREGTNFSSLVREGVAQVVKKKKISTRSKEWGKNFFGAYKGKVKKSGLKLIHDYYMHDVV